MQDKITITEPRARLHNVAGAIVVTAPMPEGIWIATFPGFVGRGATERDALLALSAEIASVARDVALIGTTGARVPDDPRDIVSVQTDVGAYAGVATAEGSGEKFALVWARSDRAARMFFGVPETTPVKVIKEGPETEEEKRRYVGGAKLFGVKCEPKFPGEQSTAGARRFK